MYNAAYAGCQRCVAHFLEVEKLPPDSRSENAGYTVLDWALYARDKHVAGADTVIEYLNDHWPGLRAQDEHDSDKAVDLEKNQPARGTSMNPARKWTWQESGKRVGLEQKQLARGLDTPLAGGFGSRIMEGMGWNKGETLGVNGAGLLEPLRPDLNHRGREGLGLKRSFDESNPNPIEYC